ncbi:serpin family protein [bacterium]|nr:serpin family protein [bacterium]
MIKLKAIHAFLLLGLICASLIFCFCTNNPVSSEARDLTLLEKQLVESDNRFGFKLFKEIVEAKPNSNIFISPLSISMALGMTLNGANGETKTAMEQTLELAGMSTDEINQSYRTLIDLLTQLDPRAVFDIANSIWYRAGMNFEQDFLDRNQTYFDAVVGALDFEDPRSVDIINDWVNENTNGKIPQIIDEITDELVMFLINAIYFNGTWTYEFDKEHTQDDVFILPGGSEQTCRMMIQTNEFNYMENDDFQAIDLPYGEGAFRMTIFLPRPNRDITGLVEGLDAENWNNWLHSFSKDSVTLQLPKFKMEYEIELNDVLSALGMGVAFDRWQADFTRMYKPGGTYISFVKHKTFLEVDEEGTEAAAATVVAIGIVSVQPPRQMKYMRVDRPFLFVIRESHSGALLFMGKIVEPRSE